jgi:AAHS family 3-hydroxyphenylpropionic acid transporter
VSADGYRAAKVLIRQNRHLLLSLLHTRGFRQLVVSLTLASLAPRYYPTLRRGTATGAAVGAARLGAIFGPAAVGLLLGTGLRPSQVLWSLVPVALVGGLAAYMLLTTGKLAHEVPGEEAASSVVDSAYP